MTELMPFIIVFFGGVASVFSPCVLPLVPIYFSILAKNTKNLILSIGLLLIGFISSFFIMQLLIYKFANLMSYFFGELHLAKILGILIILFSLHTLGILKLNFLNMDRRKELSEKVENTGYLFPLLLGFTLGLGWSPCTGPILFTVMGYATTSKSILGALSIMGSYSLGFALPFIVLSIMIVKYKKTTIFLNKYMPIIQKISGVLLLIVGVAMFFDKLSILYSIS